jgi:sterol 24-C-methyltransferase
MSWSGKLVSHTAIKVMEMVGLLPKGTYDVGESLKVAADALVKGGQTKVGQSMFHRFEWGLIIVFKLFTPMYLAICRKPVLSE